jgi:hypothetical protein
MDFVHMAEVEQVSWRHVVAHLRVHGGVSRDEVERLRLKAPFFDLGIRMGTFAMCHF